MDDNVASINATLQQLDSLITQLSDVLEAENALLNEPFSITNIRSLSDALEQTSATKVALCTQLNNPDFFSLQDAIATLQGADQANCEARHKKLIDEAQRLQDSNLVNGKIIGRTQYVVREILHILSGSNAEGLYGQTGQQNNANQRARGAIARA